MWKYLRYGVLGLGIALIATAVFFDSEPELTFAASGDVFFNDTFTDTENTDLDAHTPNTGTSWTQVYQIGGSTCSNDPTLDISSTNTLDSDCNDATIAGTAFLADATYPSADYQVQYVATDPGETDNYLYSTIRATDTFAESNGGYVIYDVTDSVGDDALLKVITGTDTCTTLDTQFTGSGETGQASVSAGGTILFQAVANEVFMSVSNVARLYATNTAITTAGKGGIGMGALPCNDGGDIVAGQQEADDFQIIEVATASTTYRRPTTTGETDNDFTNPTNVYSDNLSYAEETTVADAQDYGDFGFSIPAGSTIDGLQCRAGAEAGFSGSWVGLQLEVSLDNGATWSSSLATRYWSNTKDYQIFGHANYLWGETWTVTDTADTDFRVRLTHNEEESSTASRDLEIDSLDCVFFYTESGGGDGDGDGDVQQDVIWFD